jgi:hypothetical protein
LRKENVAAAAFRARHEVAMAAAATDAEERTWVRVPAHVPMAVQRIDSHHQFFYEHLATHDLSAGAISFLCGVPPAPGEPIHFTLDLGEKWPLSLRGVVARTEREAPGDPTLARIIHPDRFDSRRMRGI